MSTESRPAVVCKQGMHVQTLKSWLRTLWRFVRWPLILYLCVMVATMFFEESMIFLPTPYPQGDWHPEGLKIEDARFEAADGTRIHGWYVPHEDPRAVVLFCHGNAGNVSHRIDTLRALHDRVGVSVLIFDYRGYGRSEGKPNEAGLLADARAARAWLAQRAEVAETDIVLIGRSIGGGVAVDLAAKQGARALVLESTFSSLVDVAAYHYPWLPIRWLLHTRFDSMSKIAAYHGPLLQSHGNADTIVPLRFGERLFQAANEPKQFITLEGFDHDWLPWEYYDELASFLAGLKQGPAEADRSDPDMQCRDAPKQ